MSSKPDAFLSYTRFDDRRGKISEFRLWLSEAVEEVSGNAFKIFQDTDVEGGVDIGQHWRFVLDEMLDRAHFFIPILTPKFFNSALCRNELESFLKLKGATDYSELILPIYWITCPVLEEPHLKAKDSLAQAIDTCQRMDWRRLVRKSLETENAQTGLVSLANQIVRAQRRLLKSSNETGLLSSNSYNASVPPGIEANTPKILIHKHQRQGKAKNLKPSQSKNDGPNQLTRNIFRDFNAAWAPQMKAIPGGAFKMGSTTTGGFAWERPRHNVLISSPYAIAIFPVTFEEYDYFCDATGREMPDDAGWGRLRRPAVNVSWHDANDYCEWLSEVIGQQYKLCSEAQWEHACRAETTTAFFFGSEISNDLANFGCQLGGTAEVGRYPGNRFGLHDMHGNVWEWCLDRWHESYDGAPIDCQPWLDGPGNRRVLRGGAWDVNADFLRSSYRKGIDANSKSNSVGFRIARSHSQ